jgi:DNA invertase Pin-like site-specific DNA recombinase
MRIGYARVSSPEQRLALQLEALEHAGCERVFTDEASGRKGAERTGLDQALSHLRKDDVLVVWKLDRLGRSLRALVELAAALVAQGTELVCLTVGVDTTTPAGRFFFHVMAALAQMERELTGERTRAGLAAARRRGHLGGRPRKMTRAKLDSARRLLAAGTPPREVAHVLGVSVPTLYRWLPARDRDTPTASPTTETTPPGA